MKRILIGVAITVLMTYSVFLAQHSPLSGPMLGVVPDPNALGIRPILGIPGAAAAGSPLQFPVPLRNAIVSYPNNYAIGISDPGGQVVIVRNPLGEPSIQAIEGAADANSIVLSEDGTHAAIGTSNRIQVIGGLTTAPHIVNDIDRWALSDTPATALAVDNHGNAAVGFSNGESGAIYWFGTGLHPRPVAFIGEASDIAFSKNGSSLLVADKLRREVVQVVNPGSNPAQYTIAGESADIHTPVAVRFSPDNSRAFIADSGARSVVMIHLMGGAAASFACSCDPTTMTALRDGFMFALTEPGQGSLTVFDATMNPPRFLVVPVS